MVQKFLESIQEEGPVKTLGRVRRYLFGAGGGDQIPAPLPGRFSPEEQFTWIYRNGAWGSDESASGRGSTLAYTDNLRRKLPDLLGRYSIRSIFDAPCGDFNWMRHLLSGIDVRYIGGDIVRELTESLRARYGDGKTAFVHVDITKGPFPVADLMICRDCLFHLSFMHTRAALQSYVSSGIPYLLTTTHVLPGGIQNQDITTGGFRLIDLYGAPYHFDEQPLEKIDDWLPPDPERQMCLWTREQVRRSLSPFGQGEGVR
jgi:hypothetical protein